MKKLLVVFLVACVFCSCVNNRSNSYQSSDSEHYLNNEDFMDSLAVSHFASLYEELITYKDEQSFKKSGLAGSQKYVHWCQKVEDLKVSEGERLMKKNLLPGELRTLADLYVSSKGKETDETLYLRREFDVILNPNTNEKYEEESVDVGESSYEVIGKWDVKNKVLEELSFTIEFFKENSEWFAKRSFRDGSGDVEKLKKKGNRYDIVGNEFGEYYIINNDRLQVYGQHGLIDVFVVSKASD